MENTNTLKDLARGAAVAPDAQHPNVENKATTESKVADNTTFVGDTPVIIGAPVKTGATGVPSELMNTPTPVDTGLYQDILDTPKPQFYMAAQTPQHGASLNPNAPNPNAGIPQADLDMLEEIMPDLSVDARLEIALPVLETKGEIIKNLMITMGFTQQEAETAATNQIRKKLTDEYAAQKASTKESVGVVTIDKTDDPNGLGLTKEEHEKLEKVTKVRLVVVEDIDLANIKIERPNEEHKADYIKSIEGSLSKYAVPMPMLGDFVSFKGAPMVQMVNVINYEDSRIDEIISTKASLIYEKMIGGVVMEKYDTDGKSVMSYNEFANKFAYQDIDMALYGILCASSMEENSTSLTCNACKHEWMQKYNLKSLLRLEDIPTAFKERVDDILNFKSNDIEMRKIYEAMRRVRRYKSPFTGNVYDLSYPTIARATNLLKRVDSKDNVMTYLSAIALYLSRILIYNEAKGTYVEITAEETPLLLETMKTLTNDDINLLSKQIRDDLYYAPQFVLPAVCPSCGKKSEIPVGIDELIFLTAQDSMVEIDS